MNKTKIIRVLVASVMAISLFLVGCGGENPSTSDNGDNNSVVNKVSFQKAYDSSVIGGIGLLSSVGAGASSGTVVNGATLDASGVAFENAKDSLEPSDNEISKDSKLSDEEENEDALPNENKDNAKPENNGENVDNHNGNTTNKEDALNNLTEKEKDQILKSLAIAQSTLNGGAIKSEVKKSDNPDYQYYYTISAADITGNNNIYYFYLNGNVVPDDDDDEDEQEEKEVEEDNEQETDLSGIVILGDKTYNVVGKREVEKDEEEISFKVSIDENNYVLIEQEISAGENEFEYTSVVNGVEIYKSEVEYEINPKTGDVELSFEMEENGKSYEYSYNFFEKNGISYVEVEIEEGNTERETLIKIKKMEDGSVTYDFIKSNIEKDEED